jgi:hypothetical protein
MRRPTLPVAVFVRLHLGKIGVLAGVLAYDRRVIHAFCFYHGADPAVDDLDAAIAAGCLPLKS